MILFSGKYLEISWETFFRNCSGFFSFQKNAHCAVDTFVARRNKVRVGSSSLLPFSFLLSSLSGAVVSALSAFRPQSVLREVFERWLLFCLLVTCVIRRREGVCEL